MPGAGCSVPAHQERRDTFLRSATDQPACLSTAYSAAYSNPPRAPGQAPAPSSSQPWPGAQLGPGGQSYCKRPGRPKVWTLPAGHSRRHLPLPGSASLGRVLRPRPANRGPPRQRKEAERKHGPCQERVCVCSQRPGPALLLGHLPCPQGCCGVPPAPPPHRAGLAVGEGSPCSPPPLPLQALSRLDGGGARGLLLRAELPFPLNVGRCVYPPATPGSSPWSWL